MVNNKSTLNRGDVWDVDLKPVRGSEMGKRRPCLVVTNNIANRYSPLVTVIPLTNTAPTKAYPFIVAVPRSANLPKQSWINCSHIRTVDKDRLGKYLTGLDSDTMRKVNEAILVQLGIDAEEHQRMAG